MERQVPTGYGDLKSLVRERRGTRATFLPDDPLERGALWAGAGWMLFITVLLYLAPLVNGLIGGWAGGARAGSLPKALSSAAVACVPVALLLWVQLGVLGWPVLGLYGVPGPLISIVLSVLGLLLGAALGGALARLRGPGRQAA